MSEMENEVKPYYERDGISLYHADCLDLLPTLASRAVDTLTDPPYGIAHVWKGGSGHGWGKTDSEKEVRNAWDEQAPNPEVWPQIARVSRSQVVWGGNYFPLPPSRGWLLWVKPERHFTLSEAELAWTNIDMVMRVYEGGRFILDRKHPTEKPLGLMEWCLSFMKSSTVLDPFAGSGTTGVAAWRLGRKAILCEISEAYCELGAKRIDREISQGRLFAPEPEQVEQLTFEPESL